ncbi:stress-induced protein KIN2-like [Primulina huaijiensis]|uniref:stress-induced protein KIN2-like n=1 Tax=Primulina huaijiensis TaxID=1492673 RepID=UPI003CC6DF3E
MDRSQKASFHAGEAKGQAQEKTNQMMDNISNKAESAKESVTETGQQMKAKAQGAVDAIKDSTGMNK